MDKAHSTSKHSYIENSHKKDVRYFAKDSKSSLRKSILMFVLTIIFLMVLTIINYYQGGVSEDTLSNNHISPILSDVYELSLAAKSENEFYNRSPQTAKRSPAYGPALDGRINLVQ